MAVDIMADLLQLATELVKAYGIFGYFLVVLFGSTIPIIPVEIVLLVALAAGFDPFQLFILTTIASSIGGTAIFYAAFGFTRAIVKRESKIMKEARDLVNKYGSIAVFLGALTPFPYDPIAIVAGALKMNKVKFILATLIGRGLRFAIIIWFGQTAISILV